MSYIFKPDQFYRMPTHFGPSLGPRQGLDKRRYKGIDTPKDIVVQAIFNIRKEQVEKLLPPGFSLREPYRLCLTFDYATDIEWLAGRGYNTFGVSVPATYHGKTEAVNGDFLFVLWENMADPIITGREDLGFSKVYCELPEPQFIGDKVICRASWDGCQFATLQLSNLKQVNPDELPAPAESDGVLHYKYIPKTGCPGESDAEYAVLTPAEDPNVIIDQASVAESAGCEFRQSSWEELPTLVHIVNALSAIELGDCVEATLIKSHGGKDLSDQRILR